MVDAINSRHLPSLCSNVEQLLQSYLANTLRYSHIRIYLDNIDRSDEALPRWNVVILLLIRQVTGIAHEAINGDPRSGCAS